MKAVNASQAGFGSSDASSNRPEPGHQSHWFGSLVSRHEYQVTPSMFQARRWLRKKVNASVSCCACPSGPRSSGFGPVGRGGADLGDPESGVVVGALDLVVQQADLELDLALVSGVGVGGDRVELLAGAVDRI